jgi:hypothetical protein
MAALPRDTPPLLGLRPLTQDLEKTQGLLGMPETPSFGRLSLFQGPQKRFPEVNPAPLPCDLQKAQKAQKAQKGPQRLGKALGAFKVPAAVAHFVQ